MKREGGVGLRGKSGENDAVVSFSIITEDPTAI